MIKMDTALNAELIKSICNQLGYEPKHVVSIRISPRRCTVVYLDEHKQMATAQHPVEVTI